MDYFILSLFFLLFFLTHILFTFLFNTFWGSNTGITSISLLISFFLVKIIDFIIEAALESISFLVLSWFLDDKISKRSWLFSFNSSIWSSCSISWYSSQSSKFIHSSSSCISCLVSSFETPLSCFSKFMKISCNCSNSLLKGIKL